jgi:fatty acid desaturase
MFVLVLAGVVLCDRLWVHAISRILLGMFWQQVAFIGHDLGHNAVSHNLTPDSSWGLFAGNFCTGISIGWWRRSHNIHHIATN